MSYILHTLEPDHRVVEVVFHGSLIESDMRIAIAATIALQKETGIPDALVDATQVWRGLPVLDVVAMAEHLVENSFPAHWRQAIVKPSLAEAAVSVGLWEAAAGNRGITVRVFRDRAAALSWLVETPPVRVD